MEKKSVNISSNSDHAVKDASKNSHISSDDDI